jgi:hypothetical protein
MVMAVILDMTMAASERTTPFLRSLSLIEFKVLMETQDLDHVKLLFSLSQRVHAVLDLQEAYKTYVVVR